MTRRKKILLTFLASVVVILIALGFILPYFGAIRPESARNTRIKKLQFFRQKVKSFVQENKRLPESLFEVLHKELEQDGWSFSPKVSPIVDESFFAELKRDPFVGSDDPNSFEKIIEYGFFSGRRGWFIRELKPGQFYTKMLMIDQDERIYIIEQKTDE